MSITHSRHPFRSPRLRCDKVDVQQQKSIAHQNARVWNRKDLRLEALSSRHKQYTTSHIKSTYCRAPVTKAGVIPAAVSHNKKKAPCVSHDIFLKTNGNTCVKNIFFVFLQLFHTDSSSISFVIDYKKVPFHEETSPSHTVSGLLIAFS